MTKGPLRTIGAKIKRIKFRISIEIIVSGTTTEVATMVEIGNMTEMVIGDTKMGMGIVCMCYHIIKIMGWWFED